MNEQFELIGREHIPEWRGRGGKPVWIDMLREARDRGLVAKISITENKTWTGIRTIAYNVAKEKGIKAHTAKRDAFLLVWFDLEKTEVQQ